MVRTNKDVLKVLNQENDYQIRYPKKEKSYINTNLNTYCYILQYTHLNMML